MRSSAKSQPLLLGLESLSSISSTAIEELLENRKVAMQWWPRLIAWESRLIWILSWATITSSLFNYMMSFVTLMFAGHLGDVQLAGASLAGLALQGLVYGVMVGMASAVQTVGGQAYGASRHAVMGIICQRSIVLQLGAAIILTFLYWYSGPLLRLIGRSESAAIAEQGQIFARGLVPQLYAYALCYPMQNFLLAQNTVNPLAYISFGVFLLHVLLSWLVVYALGYGLLGAALTLSLSWWILVFAIGLYIILSPSCKDTWTGFSPQVFKFKGIWPYFKLTVCSTFMLCLDIWYCQVLLVIAELLPNTTISVDSISICVNYWNWDSNFLLGILLAVRFVLDKNKVWSSTFSLQSFVHADSVRVGNELGAGHPRVAKLSAVIMSGISILISIVFCMIILIFRVGLINLYSTDSGVIDVASRLFPLLAISIFINGIHFTLNGVIIGSGRQAIAAYANFVAYYVIGLPIACVLAFKTSLQVAGLYWGLVIGVVLQTAILALIVLRTNWNAEVEKAAARLKKSADEVILDSLVNI